MYVLDIGNKNYSSWSLRPWVLMQELNIPFAERQHRFNGSEANRQAFLKFSPSGLVPILNDEGFTVWETISIVEYLAERHEGVWPTDPQARAWGRSAMAEMHAGFSTLRNVCGMNAGARIRLPEISPKLQRDLDRLDALWGDGLDRHGGPFLLGARFSAADAFYCPVAFRVQTYGLNLKPKSMAYVEWLLALPAMQDWYRGALAEDFRDEEHEKEHRVAGEWLADYRVKAQ